MITKKLFAILLSTIIVCTPCTKLYSSEPVNIEQNSPQMDISQFDISPEQMEQVQQMQALTQEIFSNLTDQEKAELEKELESEIAKFEAMSEEEKNAYVQDATKQMEEMFTQMEEKLGQLPQEDMQPIKNKETTPEQDAAKQKKDNKKQEKENKKKLKKIIKTIEQIIKNLDSFNNKLDTIQPSAQSVIDGWIEKGLIVKWDGKNSSYETFKKDLDQMKEKIEKLKIGQATYLVNIADVEKLGGQLEMLLETIQKYEPNIQVSQKANLKDKNAEIALQNLVSRLVDTTNEISKNIDELTNKYNGNQTQANKQDEPDYSCKDIPDSK